MRQLLMLLLFPTLACQHQAPAKNRLLGAWKVIRAEGPGASLNLGTNYFFTEKEMNTSYSQGFYALKGDTIVGQYQNLPETFRFVYRFEDSLLCLQLLESSQQTLWLQKQ